MKQYASTTQIFEAFAQLTQSQTVRLERVASFHCYGSSYSDGKDLLHEVLFRAIEKERKWPVEVRFTSFMCNAIRSIASHNRNRSHQRDCMFSEEAPQRSSFTRGPSEEERALSRERLKLASKIVAYVRDKLLDDPDANIVLDGLIEGLPRKLICEESGMPFPTYSAARKRVNRRLAEAQEKAMAPRKMIYKRVLENGNRFPPKPH